jgi:MoaA/NifB/PqqE/SkfB family radical SAM enzyme
MFFKNLFLRYPSLDWIQVEISTHCNAGCIYCPRTVFRKHWKNKLLPLEIFKKLVPAFQKTRLVHLQGWGEPFIHPHFLEMLQISKKAGCLVGTTTNGTLLNVRKIEQLVNERLDIIALSIAGTDETYNDKIRQGTSLKKILETIDTINTVKARYHTDKPDIHIAYMLLRSGLSQIEKLPLLAENIGVSQVVVSSLTLVPNRELHPESVLASDSAEFSEIKRHLNQIKTSCSDKGISLYFRIAYPLPEDRFCSENIAKALVVGSDGNISPCVMNQIHTQEQVSYYFNEKEYPLIGISFGNISEQTIKTIWNKKEYYQFRNSFAENRLQKRCTACMNLYQNYF